MADARAIRNQIINNFELAVLPGVEETQVKQLLHFVIVGGGPTGIEFGAELHDFISQVLLCHSSDCLLCWLFFKLLNVGHVSTVCNGA